MINYQELKKLGLTDKEAKIYLTSLQRGPETGPTLAKLADTIRPTAYVVFKSLIDKGLMSTSEKGKKTFYIAEPPEHLVTLLRLQRKEIEEKEREISKLLPELELLANITGEKPKVRVFEGKEGLQATREIVSKIKTKEVRTFAPVDELFALFPEKEHTEVLTKKRVERKLRSKVIYTSKRGPILKSTDKQYLRESKFIQPKDFPFKSGIDIFDKSFAIYTFHGSIMGVIVENEEMTQALRAIFELVWRKY